MSVLIADIIPIIVQEKFLKRFQLHSNFSTIQARSQKRLLAYSVK